MICQKNCSINCQGGVFCSVRNKLFRLNIQLTVGKSFDELPGEMFNDHAVKKNVQWSFRRCVQRVVRDNELSGENVLICEIQCIWLNVRLTVRKLFNKLPRKMLNEL